MKMRFISMVMLCVFLIAGKAQVVSGNDLAMSDWHGVFVSGNSTGGEVASSTVILASANNVLYKGFTNPLYISAQGYANISVSATGGATVTKGNVDGFAGEYKVTIPAEFYANTITITASANGKNIGQQTFVVASAPSPMLTIGGYASGSSIPKSAIKSSPQIDAFLDPDAFLPFNNVNYNVISFTYMKEIRGVASAQIVTGNTIPEDIISDISKKPSGSSISFVNIWVETPSGQKKFGFTARLE